MLPIEYDVHGICSTAIRQYFARKNNPLGTVVERLDRFGTHAHPVQVVPSVVMPWGTHVNFLLNPLIENLNGLWWSEPKLFAFEPRLLNPHLR